MPTNKAFRLKLTNLRLYGREKDVALLEEVYHRVEGKDAGAQVVMVHGLSGAGKTAVAHSLQEIIQYDDSYYVSGKFDQQVNAKPFSALADALTELCDFIIRAPDQEEYKKRILEALRDEWTTLAQVIPNLSKLLGQDESAIKEDDNNSHPAHALIRLKTLFRALLRCVATPDHPIVMFLDDLQFGDEASIDLIGSLMVDKELNNILFIAGYRDEEVTDALSKLLKNDSFISIGLDGLSVEYINDLLADVTELRSEETLPLAEVVLKKTKGNIFFVLQFLNLAQRKGLLYFSMEKLKWTWDVRKIESEMNVSNNVVDLVVDRLQEFPEDIQVLLNIASCIGAQFDAQLLATLYKHKDEELESAGICVEAPIELAAETDEEKARAMLQMVEEQELIIAGDKMQYMFSHDRIQQASYLLLLEGREKRLMELRVGLQLLRLFHSSMSQRWMIFVAVESLDRSADLLGADEKVKLARLNLDAAKRAKQESAFLLAAGYLRKGIELLGGPKMWTDNYNLTLEMYTLSAEMEHTGGNNKKAEAMATELIKGASVHEEDKIPLYFSLMLSAGDQVKLELALDSGIEALARLGVHVPRNPRLPRVLWHLLKTEKLLKGMTDDELLSLPEMKDEKKIQAMHFLRPMLIYAWVLGADKLLSVIFMKEMRLSLRYGACEMTPAAFASYGMLMASLWNSGEAFRFGKLAERMLEEDEERGIASKAFTLTVVHALCHHWRRPLVNSLDPLLEAHRVGMMQSGDVEWACLASAVYSGVYIHAGLPLEPFTSDTKKLIQVNLDYDQEISLIYSTVPLQFALNLLGRSEDPLVLTGEGMNEKETLRQLRETNQKTGLFYTTYFQMKLKYIMGEFDAAHQHARELWALHCNTYKGHLIWNEALFFSGLAEFAYARQHGMNVPPKRGMKYLTTIAGYEKEGGMNQHPMRLLLEAEAATFVSKDRNEGRRLFDIAISTANRCGFTHYAAIANERAGEYMLNPVDKFWSQTYITDARDCYVRWGAVTKAAQLEERFEQFFSGRSRRKTVSMNLRGKERYSVLPMGRGISELQRESDPSLVPHPTSTSL